jgi:hypothetical protein
VEAAIANPRRSAPKKEKKAPKKEKKAPKRPRFTREEFEIHSILEEKKVSGKERLIYLVQWSGYDLSWEPSRATGQVGDPITTWEPLLLVQYSDALREFRQRTA